MNRLDKHTKVLVDIFTSRTLIILVMLLFMGGIVGHLHAVFDNWFLAISAQFTVILLTINAKFLPSIVTEQGIRIPILNFLVALFMVWFIYSNLQVSHPANFLDIRWFVNISQAIFFGILELSFSFLMVSRMYDDIAIVEKSEHIDLDDSIDKTTEIVTDKPKFDTDIIDVK